MIPFISMFVDVSWTCWTAVQFFFGGVRGGGWNYQITGRLCKRGKGEGKRNKEVALYVKAKVVDTAKGERPALSFPPPPPPRPPPLLLSFFFLRCLRRPGPRSMLEIRRKSISCLDAAKWRRFSPFTNGWNAIGWPTGRTFLIGRRVE